MERMAGRFKRRLEAYAKKNKIPFLYSDAGGTQARKGGAVPSQGPGFHGNVLGAGRTCTGAGVGSGT